MPGPAHVPTDRAAHRPTGPKWEFTTDGRPARGWTAQGGRTSPRTRLRPVAEPAAPEPGPGSALVPSASWLLDLSQPSPSGRYFAPLMPPTPSAPSAPASVFVVHIVLDGGGFRIDGRPVTPRMLASAVRACPEWRGRPVLALTVGPADDDLTEASGVLLGALARALEVSVSGCDMHAFVGPGLVVTDGSFRRWNPPGRRRPGTPKSRDLGPLLPAAP